MLAACGGGGGEILSAGSQPAGANAPQAQRAPVADPSVVASANTTDPARQSSAATQADATQARFNRPLGIAADTSGNLYVADSFNDTVRKIAANGAVTTLAGMPGMAGSADGVGAAARFSAVKGVAVDAHGNVYVVDGNAIRRITPDGTVSTLAGTPGTAGDADGAGQAAQFNQPWGIAIDHAGNLYVADTGNYLVRKVTPAGAVSTLAGARGMRGKADGSGPGATFLGPRAIAIDGAGNLYLTDWFGPPAPNIPQSSTFVRKITPAGAVSTLAGNYRSENGDALFRDAFAIAADPAGNAYVAAQQSIRKVSADGAVSTVANSNTAFDALQGVTIDAAGNLYVTDTFTVSKVAPGGTITLVAGKPGEAGSADTAQ